MIDISHQIPIYEDEIISHEILFVFKQDRHESNPPEEVIGSSPFWNGMLLSVPWKRVAIGLFLFQLILGVAVTFRASLASAKVNNKSLFKGIRGLGVSMNMDMDMDMDESSCSFGLNITCEDLSSGLDCATFQKTWTDYLPSLKQCRSNPIEASMLYTGAKCSQNNVAFEPTCIDFNGGPSKIEGDVSFIRISSDHSNEIIYFEGFVRVMDVLSISNNFEPISDTLRVSIYSSANTSSETLLQESVFPFSCTKDPRIKLLDSIGGLQFIEFTSIEQGHQAAFAAMSFNLKFNIKVTNEGIPPAHLTSMSVTSNFHPFFQNFTNQIPNSGYLDADESVEFQLVTRVDPFKDFTYSFFGTMGGRSRAGNDCISNQLGNAITWKGSSSFVADPTAHVQMRNNI